MVIQGELSLAVTIAAGFLSLLAAAAWAFVTLNEGRHAHWWWVNISLTAFCGWFAVIYGLVLFGAISSQQAGIYLRPATAGMMFVLACLTLRFQPSRGLGLWKRHP